MDEKNKMQKTLLYIGEEGEVSLDVIVDSEGETFWTTQKTMANVFNVSKSTISEHLKHIFEEEELEKNSVVRKFRTTASDVKNIIQISTI